MKNELIISLLRNQQYIDNKILICDIMLEEELGLKTCEIVDILICNKILCKNSVHFRKNKYFPKGYAERLKEIDYRYLDHFYIKDEKGKYIRIDTLILPYLHNILSNTEGEPNIQYIGILFTQKGKEWFIKNLDKFMSVYIMERITK